MKDESVQNEECTAMDHSDIDKTELALMTAQRAACAADFANDVALVAAIFSALATVFGAIAVILSCMG